MNKPGQPQQDDQLNTQQYFRATDAHQSDAIKRFPILQTAINEIQKTKVDQYEIFFEHATDTDIDSREYRVDTMTCADDAGLSVRVIKNGSMGFSFTTSLDPETVAHTCQMASEVANVLPADPLNHLLHFGEFDYPKLEALDTRGLEHPIQEKVQIAMDIEEACRQHDPRIVNIRAASFGQRHANRVLIDSNAQVLHHEYSIFSGSVLCKAQDGDDTNMGYDYFASVRLEDLNPKDLGQKAAISALETLNAKAAPTMQCPAIFRNTEVASLIGFLASHFSGEEIDKGRSMLKGKEGEQVFSTLLNLIDDGLYAGGYASTPFDAEGHPCGTYALIQNGILKQSLYDSYYAKKFSKTSTGSARRAIKAPPTIGTRNYYLQNGTTPISQLANHVDRGILVTDLMGVHTANPVTGDFSLGATGLLIEGGKITRPVRGFAVAGNILDVFKKVIAVGDDLKFMGSTGAPSLLVSEISVSGE